MACFDKLNKVPCSLITQLRRINELDKYRLKENSPVSTSYQQEPVRREYVQFSSTRCYCFQMKKFLGNKKGSKGEMIMRPIDNEVDFQEGVIRINAPQFNLYNVPIILNRNTTAGDVVLKYLNLLIEKGECKYVQKC